MSYWLGVFLIYIFIAQDFTHSLRLVEVRIPNYVIKGSAAQLECLYDLDGEALYSVKWYKDGNEFYRYVPRDMPPAQTFLLPGVSVDLHNSSDALVTLKNVNLNSAGRFRCEVSGEAPSFQTVTEHGDMVVVSLPDQGPPKISGGRPRYQIGDWVHVNCTAGRSKPAVLLSWFVNGEPAEPHTLKKYDTIVAGREGLETSVLGLRFRVEQHHFRHGDMKLKCVASLSTFYWRSNEESVEGDRPQKAPVLESRETVYASNSRADPVQASNKTDSVLMAHAPNLIILLLLTMLTNGCLEHFFMSPYYLVQKKQKTSKQQHKQIQTVKTRRNTALHGDEQEEEKEVDEQQQQQRQEQLNNHQTQNMNKKLLLKLTATTITNNNAENNNKSKLIFNEEIQCFQTKSSALFRAKCLDFFSSSCSSLSSSPSSSVFASASALLSALPIELLLLFFSKLSTSASASTALASASASDLENQKQQKSQQQHSKQTATTNFLAAR